MDRQLRVFPSTSSGRRLCHASQDKLIVRELYRRLLAEGWIDPWLDEEKLLPSQEWDMEIGKAWKRFMGNSGKYLCDSRSKRK